jgi:eukaryotic-like serine/threonine-protein kinase
LAEDSHSGRGGPADGRSELFEKLARPGADVAEGTGGDPTRQAPASVMGGPDGRSALFEQLVRTAVPGISEGERSRILVEAVASIVAGADGRSALLEQFARTPAGVGDPAELSRLAVKLLATGAPGADGRSALLEQLVRSLPPQGEGGGPPPTVADLVASLLAAPEGRSALLQQLARDGGDALGSPPIPPERTRGPAPPRPPGKELAPGMVVGRFEMVKEIGSGGFGVVFEARDRDLGRSVAFKAVRPGVRTRQLDTMLLQEAESAARLQHENIVSIFDYGQGEAGPYLVLELLKGETLAARLARGPMPVNEVVHVGIQVARALAHAHGAGLLHRDLKPANVFLTEAGGVKVMDLGLAHFFGQPTGLSGTPAYMAPEQWKGEAQDGRTDVFALGVTLFEMLAGRRPYEVRSDRSTVLDPGPEPVLAAPGVPPRLRKLVERCIAKDPAKRPASARAVQEDLVALGRVLDARPARRNRRLVAAAAALVALLAAAGGAWWTFFRPPEERVPLAVADFDDRTGEEGLDGLSSLLITSLQESKVLDVLPRSRMRDVLRMAGKDVTSRIDEKLGRELGKLAGVRALLLGTLHRFGDVYALEVQAIDPATDQQLFAVKDQGQGKGSLPDVLDRVSGKVRAGLRERSGAIRKNSVRLSQAVTPNMDAWQHYFRGLECSERFVLAGSYGDCLDDFKKAIAIDPGFALAHFQISYLYFWQGLPRAAQKAALEPALKDEARIPPKDRMRVEGWAAFLDGKDVEAKALLEKAAREAPDDKFIWYLAGEVPFHRDEFAESVPFFQHAHDLDPIWLMPTQHLALALGPVGKLEPIRAMVSRLESLGPKPGALVGLCYAYLWVDPARSRDACDRGIAAGAGLVGQEFLAIDLLTQGPRPELDALLQKMGAGRKPGELGFEWYMTLLLRGQEGRWSQASEQVQQAGDPEDSWFHGVAAELFVGAGDRAAAWKQALRALEIDKYSVNNLAVHFAYMGDLVHAAELLPYLPAGSPRVETYRAVVKWRQGDLPTAIEQLRKVAEASPLSVDPATPFPIFLLGEALSEAGRDAEAIAVLRRFLAMPLHNPSWQRSRALFFLARSLDRSGEKAAAREAVGRLLASWRDASPSEPLLADARAMGAKLGVR